MRPVKKVLVIFFLFLACMLFAQALSAEVLLEEVKRMRQIFSEQVQKSPVQENYAQLLATLSKESLSSQPEGLPSASQFFLIIDRSPRAQTASFAFFDANSRSVSILGTDKTSTGKASRLGSFETPVGVFKNTVYNPSYRALGTKNDKGWRGLGATGSRVWDFGWQKTKTRKGEDFNIRLLVHATDPDHGEKRLGIQDSQGCIRLSAKFNRFLDYYGILDAEYEKNEKAKWVLLKKREPSLLAGSLVIVVDSSP